MMAIYSKGKRTKRKKLNKKGLIITILLLLIIIGSAIYLIFGDRIFLPNLPYEQVGNNENENSSETNEIEENIVEAKQDEISNVEIPKKMSGYNVLGKLVIDKIGVNKNILSTSTTGALNVSVCKDYGPDINKPGNFCMCGHNWKSILQRLKELEPGDTFYLINRETKTKVTYEVYKVYVCGPYDTSCLDQNNDGKREATIYTCTPGGKQRVVCKAREI